MSNEREGPCYADLREIIRCVDADVQAEMLIRPEGIRAENTVADRERHPAYREQRVAALTETVAALIDTAPMATTIAIYTPPKTISRPASAFLLLT